MSETIRCIEPGHQDSPPCTLYCCKCLDELQRKLAQAREALNRIQTFSSGLAQADDDPCAAVDDMASAALREIGGHDA